ncbi:OsmC family protein [Exilibacterium tricleocarpae]|uniref:OsmC family protein n=1 Tax=Exilibacterium tricleocarpae TaxID=2591008 RepID=A0A545TFP2_9GAMM|nr:bifunctional alpha/beta hydrolase/OsmC family protein [Exilibacterium tricleocarpae]TQV76015.1 OsmC family protein [Exilibacterium tricleocarpae]
MSGKRTRVEFPGYDGGKLVGLLETPTGKTLAYVLFAHCFTCGKDSAAASRISRALVAGGYAVLRFDFTGLGGSDGDFANTHFSSNVQDLLAAAAYLRQNYQAPAILVGHSLGGAAVLSAAHQLSEVRGVATIAAPADAAHVAKQFHCDIAAIEAAGEAQVELAGRTFTIKKSFLDDIAAQDSAHIGALRASLLLFHSPLDTMVSIAEAEKIYRAARHPKSFLSLDKADHLLSNKADAEYVAACIAAWAGRFVESQAAVSERKTSTIEAGQIGVEERNHKFSRNVFSDHHFWLADEPVAMGGDDLGPDPYEHLLAALGTCTSMTIRLYANHKKIPLDDVKVTLSQRRLHGKDCEACEQEGQYIQEITRHIFLSGDLSEAQRQRILEIADKCPVHKTLQGKVVIDTELRS